MREKLRKLIGCPLPRAYWAGLEHDLMRTGYWPTLLVGIAILVFEAGMMISSALRAGLKAPSGTATVYFTLYFVLFVVTLACLAFVVALRKRFEARPRIFLYISISYGFMICLWGSYLSAFTHRNSADVTVLLYTVLGVAIVITMRPWQAFLVFTINLLFFYACLHYYAPAELDLYGSTINSLITTFLGILISSILYRSRSFSYFNRVTIVQQNEKIQLINDRLRDLVLFDDLTGAYNRRYFDDVLPERLEGDRHVGIPITVMMLDIDRFKQYNDIYGHQQGDRCLVSLADIVRNSTLSEDAAFVRYGGEEFVLYLAGPDEDAAFEVAERIRRNIARARMEHSGAPSGYVTISIGVALGPPRTQFTLYDLVHDADQALYAAKNAGRNRVIVYSPPSPAGQA